MAHSAAARPQPGVRRLQRGLVPIATAVALALSGPALGADGDVDLGWEDEFGPWSAFCEPPDAAGSSAFCGIGILDGNRAGLWVIHRLHTGQAPVPAVRVVVGFAVDQRGPLTFSGGDGSEISVASGFMVQNNRVVELYEESQVTAVMDLLGSGIGALTVTVPLRLGDPVVGAFDVSEFGDALAALSDHVAGWPGE